MSVFGERLTYFRKEIAHMPRKQMADKLKVSYPTYSNWENGRRIPDAEIMAEVAKELHTSLDFLQGLTDDPNPKGNIIDIKHSPITLAYDGTVATEDDMDIIKSIIARHKRNKETNE